METRQLPFKGGKEDGYERKEEGEEGGRRMVYIYVKRERHEKVGVGEMNMKKEEGRMMGEIKETDEKRKMKGAKEEAGVKRDNIG